MASAEEYVSAETLAQVSSESFAQNLSNYRSLLLQYEREVESGMDDTRARLLFREAAMLQEIVQDQMRSRGRDLGVPPAAVQEVATIYQRALAKLLFRVVQDSYLTDPAVTSIVERVESTLGAPAEMVQLVQKIKLARTAYQSVLLTPAAASMVAPSLVKLLEQIGGAARLIQEQLPPMASQSGPPAPPSPPAKSGGDGQGGDLPRRVDRLETKVDRMSEDIGDIRVRLGRMEERLAHVSTKADVADAILPVKTSVSQINERLTHIPTKFDLVKAAIAIPGITWLVSKYADPLVAAIGRAFAQ